MKSRTPRRSASVRANSAAPPSNLSLLKARIKLYDAKLQVLEDTRKAINKRPTIEEVSLLNSSFVHRIATGTQTAKGRKGRKRPLETTALPMFESDSDFGDTARKCRYTEEASETFKAQEADTRIMASEAKSPYESQCLKEREHFENMYLSPIRQSCEIVVLDEDKENGFELNTKSRLESLEAEVQRLKQLSESERRNKEEAVLKKDSEISVIRDKFEHERSLLLAEVSRLKIRPHSRHSKSLISPAKCETRHQELQHKNELLTKELSSVRHDRSERRDNVYANLVEENSRLKTQNCELVQQLKGKTELVCSKCRAFLMANGELTFKLSKLKALVDC